MDVSYKTLVRHAKLYKSYCEVIKKYGRLAPHLASGFLIGEACEPLGYSVERGRKIISMISKDRKLLSEVENIIHNDL